MMVLLGCAAVVADAQQLAASAQLCPGRRVRIGDPELAARVKEMTKGAQTPRTSIPGERLTKAELPDELVGAWCGQDCRPVAATVLPNGNYYLPASDEIIPADMAAPSPDDRFHYCTYYPMAADFFPWGGPIYESEPKTRCFFAPMHSS